MGLEEYRRKRDFDATSEPAGTKKRSTSKLIYVVQHHFARSEHYDFRLELDGVLKSWAVPKEPQPKTGERRLAVEVEDHPIEYATFEGTIPAGQYGAGEVEQWDRGTWTSEGDPHEGLKRGKLNFVLEGERLSGAWTLVRMRGSPEARGKRNWLLIPRSERPGVESSPPRSSRSPARAPARPPARKSRGGS